MADGIESDTSLSELVVPVWDRWETSYRWKKTRSKASFVSSSVSAIYHNFLKSEGFALRKFFHRKISINCILETIGTSRRRLLVDLSGLASTAELKQKTPSR